MERPRSASSSVSLRSSLWVLRDSGWQILFHQGTKTRYKLMKIELRRNQLMR